MDVELAIDELLESRSSETGELVGVTSRLIAQLEHLAKATPGKSAAPTARRQPDDGPIVLHIEDNLSNLKLVERVLAQRPTVQLIEAQSGEKGLELAKSLTPALVLLDLRLGDISGEAVLERLRADPATNGLRVVVVSAEARPAEASRLIGLGADDYLVKPIEIESLLEIVDGALEPEQP
jgi:CheY-like chemotaxis protein